MRAVLGILASIGTTLGLGMAAIECHEGAGWLASRIVQSAARRLPARLRDIREQEWLAELHAFEGLRIFKLLWSFGIYFAAIRLRFRYRGEHRAERFPEYTPSPDVIVAIRQHPAMLIWGIASALWFFLMAILYSFVVTNMVIIVAIWLVWLLSALSLGLKFRKWCAGILVLTPDLLSSSAWARSCNGFKISPHAMSRVIVRRSLFGRFLNYGTLTIEESGRVHTARFVPYPLELLTELGYWVPGSYASFSVE